MLLDQRFSKNYKIIMKDKVLLDKRKLVNKKWFYSIEDNRRLR